MSSYNRDNFIICSDICKNRILDQRIIQYRKLIITHQLRANGNEYGILSHSFQISNIYIDGIGESLCLISQTGSIYELFRRVSSCIYGEVLCGIVIQRNSYNQYIRTNYLVSIKRTVVNDIINKTTQQHPLLHQEDEIMNILTLQYLNNDPLLSCPSLDILDPSMNHISKLIDILLDDDNMYVITDWNGTELYQALTNPMINPHRKYDEVIAKVIFKQIVIGVNFLHSIKNICHLDLSLENILIDNNKNVTIIDFGLCKRYEGINICDMCISGKKYYVAPEIYALQDFDGIKADIWSCGIILYMLLTGKVLYQYPIDIDPNFQLLVSNRFDLLFSEDRIHTFLSDSVKDLLSKMLVVRPFERRIDSSDILNHEWLGD